MGRKPKLPDPDMYAVAAAYLSGKGESQEQIADILNVSQPAVCRLLNGPVAKSCLKISNPEFSCPKELQPLWDKAQTTFFPCTDLLEKLQATCRNGRSFLQKVVLVYGHAGEGIGPAVVPAVEDVLGKAGILGITWGKTISDLIEMLQVHLRAPLRSQNPVN